MQNYQNTSQTKMPLGDVTNFHKKVVSKLDLNIRPFKSTTVPEMSHFDRENSCLIASLGGAVYEESKRLEISQIKWNFLTRHPLEPSIRTKMIDWMLEVLNYYKCSDETFFLAVSMLDQFIANAPFLIDNRDIHLLGITCLFVSNKFVDLIQIKMKNLVKKVSFNNFSRCFFK